MSQDRFEELLSLLLDESRMRVDEDERGCGTCAGRATEGVQLQTCRQGVTPPPGTVRGTECM